MRNAGSLKGLAPLGAHAHGSAAFVLQDWFGASALATGVNPEVQRFGRAP
jgi:hypothetical protein